jgi:hypothetical protein
MFNDENSGSRNIRKIKVMISNGTEAQGTKSVSSLAYPSRTHDDVPRLSPLKPHNMQNAKKRSAVDQVCLTSAESSLEETIDGLLRVPPVASTSFILIASADPSNSNEDFEKIEENEELLELLNVIKNKRKSSESKRRKDVDCGRRSLS